MKMRPPRMLLFALALVLAHGLALALGWDAGLEALTGMYGGASERWRVLAALFYALSWIGAVALAPIVAAGALLSLLLNKLLPTRAQAELTEP